uniref:Uncharacterized protein n=1 Tax=Arundo donax TaxID=35708 RepID=A0A0A9B755_ARUDO
MTVSSSLSVQATPVINTSISQCLMEQQLLCLHQPTIALTNTW